MVQFASLWDGLAKSVSIKKGKNFKAAIERETAEELTKEARKNDLVLSSSGTINSIRSGNLASVFSKRGEKGMNQDCIFVREEFGGQDDITFCGVFDGHGPWGHVVAKRIRDLMPSSMLCNWQETLAQKLQELDLDLKLDKKSLDPFDIWKQSCIKSYAAIDQELEQHPGIDSFFSGSTSVTLIKQGDVLIIANVGDSRAVLATTSDDGSLIPVQLTVDFKPNLPQEAERISQSKGRVFSLDDEPGVYRIWRPNCRTPGLAISRAFGDYCMKDFGLISVPEVTQRIITSKDQFAILATDGVWDVVSNHEAVQIVGSTPDKENSAKRLVKYAANAWKHKKRGLAMDDISAICLFFHTSPLH